MTNVALKLMEFAPEMMEFALKLMEFALEMMKFALEMMEFALKMAHPPIDGASPRGRKTLRKVIIFSTESTILNTKCIVFSTKPIIFNAKSIIFNTKIHHLQHRIVYQYRTSSAAQRDSSARIHPTACQRPALGSGRAHPLSRST